MTKRVTVLLAIFFASLFCLSLAFIIGVGIHVMQNGGMNEPCNQDGSCDRGLSCQPIPQRGFICGPVRP